MQTAERTSRPAESEHSLSVGSLVYSRSQLIVLSLWLLWGDFAFTFFESIFAKFIPIFLKHLNASNTLIGVMTGSFAGLVNVLFLPFISRWCDDLRTPIGRRIPLLYVITPLTAAMLIGIGFAPEIGGWLFRRARPLLPDFFSEEGTILGLLCVLVVSFHFFNMVLVNAYNWLIRDVIPLSVMSRFLAWFSIIGTVSGAAFLFLVFPHLMTYRREIFLGVGVFYIVAFTAMCWKVREGSYPDPVQQKAPFGVISTFALYFKECLQISLYRNFFVGCLLVTAALSCANNFIILFADRTLGLGMGDMGEIFAWTAMISLLFFYPLGWLCDRFSPMHVALGATVTIGLGALLALLFVENRMGFLIYSLAFSLPTVAWYLSQRAASMKLFPAEKFGQFSSGLNVFGCGALIVGNLLIGVLMDVFQSNYRMAFLWTGCIAAVAVIPFFKVIGEWKRLGGRENYVPPMPE